MLGRPLFSLALFVVLAGCDDTTAPAPAVPGPRTDTSSRFDRTRTGTIRGRVVWNGAVPKVFPFRSIEEPFTDRQDLVPRDWPNPHAPVIGPGRTVSSAVVFLRGVEPSRGRPWDHSAVKVTIQDHAFSPKVAFVRAGDEVAFVSRQKTVHMVQARGADFFSVPLPDSDQELTRPLAKTGIVELHSGAGHFWMRAYLFVDHHPYYTLPDSQGEFRLAHVPEGEYDLVAWHADWRVLREERNAESMRVQQVRFAAPFEVTQRVRVTAGQDLAVDLSLAAPQ